MSRTAAASAVLTAITAAAISLSGCGSPSAPSAAGSSTTSSTGTASSSPSSTAAPASPSASASGTRAPRTSKELKKAVLTLKDMPSGFATEPVSTGNDGGSASSSNPKCAALVKLTNADRPTGSRGTAEASFSGGQDGPFIDQSLDAMPSAKAATAFLSSFRAAVKACPSLTLRISGQGSAPVQVREVSAPEVGDDSFATRFTATSGALDGLELTMVAVRVDDVLMAMTYVAAAPEDVDGATQVAVDKAKRILVVPASTT